MQNKQSISNFTNNQSVSNFTNNQGTHNKHKITNKNTSLIIVSHVPRPPKSITFPKSMLKSIAKNTFVMKLQETPYVKFVITGIGTEDFDRLIDEIEQDIKNLKPYNDKPGHFLLHDETIDKNMKILDMYTMLFHKKQKYTYVDSTGHVKNIDPDTNRGNAKTYYEYYPNGVKDSLCENKLHINKMVTPDIQLYLKNANDIQDKNIYHFSLDSICKNFTYYDPLSFNEKYFISQSIKNCIADIRYFYSYESLGINREQLRDVAKTKIINADKHIVYTLSDIKGACAKIGLIGDKYTKICNSTAYEFSMFCELNSEHVLNFRFLLNKVVFDFKYMDNKKLVVNFSPFENNDLSEYRPTYQVTFRLPQKKNEIKKFIDSFIIFQKVATTISKVPYGSIYAHRIELKFNLQIIRGNIDDDQLEQALNRYNKDDGQAFDQAFNRYAKLRNIPEEEKERIKPSVERMLSKGSVIDEESKETFQLFLDAIISKDYTINKDDFDKIIKIKLKDTNRSFKGFRINKSKQHYVESDDNDRNIKKWKHVKIVEEVSIDGHTEPNLVRKWKCKNASTSKNDYILEFKNPGPRYSEGDFMYASEGEEDVESLG